MLEYDDLHTAQCPLVIAPYARYVAANAQQVVGYFFGSSNGSADKTDDLAAAVRGVWHR